MGERADAIEREIEQERAELGRNLEELETRVKEAADWRVQFERHSGAMMALAFGGGLLLAALIGGRRNHHGDVLRRLEAARYSS
jgi:DNA repair exonuclease SbcCD ATPase subunit